MLNNQIAECPWLEGRVPNGFWDARHNRVQYMEWLGQQCGFRNPEDWYAVRKQDFKTQHGGGLLSTRYNDSFYAALRDYFPDYDWLPWRFRRTPNEYWIAAENRREYLRWLQSELNISSPEGWYDVTRRHVHDHHGGGLLMGYYGDSVLEAVREFLPDYPWKPWLFRETPNGFWQSRENRVAYIHWLGAELGFESKKDWYRITRRAFLDHAGGGLLGNYYNDSPQRAVQDMMPEFPWKPWLFTSVPQRFWRNVDNRISYFRWLRTELGFRSAADWFRLSIKDIRHFRGAGLLRFYAENPLGDDALGRALSEAMRGPCERPVIWPVIQVIECSLSPGKADDLLRALV